VDVNAVELLLDAFGRIPEMAHGVLDGLSAEELTFRLDSKANTIAWLVWHMSRIEDDHVSAVAGHSQVWTAQGWSRRWGLELDDGDTGYAHTARQVAAVTGDEALLRGYFDAVHQSTAGFVRGLTEGDLDRVVDGRWDPPVTLGVRLVSVAGHDFEQAAQADFVRGIVLRRRRSRRAARPSARGR
jgi:DinB superfamily